VPVFTVMPQIGSIAVADAAAAAGTAVDGEVAAAETAAADALPPPMASAFAGRPAAWPLATPTD